MADECKKECQSEASPLSAEAQNLGLETILTGLITTFGPRVADLLIELLKRRRSKAPEGVAADEAVPAQLDLLNVKSLIVVLVERYGASVLEQLATMLENDTSVVSKVAAQLIRNNAELFLQLLLSFLNSEQGDAALASAMEKVAVTNVTC